ncbi:MAG: hypothetical protein AABW88_00740 [Nanoarchaeota archaeon]
MVLFFILLIIKEIFWKIIKKDFCAICASVSLTWIGLLVLYWSNLFNNTVILALLIGESIVGTFYLVEAKVRKEFTLFRLPFLLTLIVIGYSLIEIPSDLRKIIIFIIILWMIFIFAHLYRNNGSISSFIKKIVECCRRW